MTKKQFLIENPNKYVMVTYEFGDPVYVAPTRNMRTQTTQKKEEAEVWTEFDNNPGKIEYARIATGYNGLKFEQI